MEGSPLPAFVVALALLSGCTSKPVVVSRTHSDGAIPAGVVYSLPRQLIQIKFTREVVSYDKLLEAHTKQKDAADKADAALATAKARVAELTAQVEAAKDADAKKKLEGELAVAKAIQDAADVAQKKAAAELAKARQALQQAVDFANELALYEKGKAALAELITKLAKLKSDAEAIDKKLATQPPPPDEAALRAEREGLEQKIQEQTRLAEARVLAVAQQNQRVVALGQSAYQDTFAVQLPAVTPDPDKRFVATLTEGKARSTKLELTTSAAGLLEGSIGTAESKQADIIVESIGAIGAALKAGQTFKTQNTSLTEAADGTSPTLPTPFTAQWVVDPVATTGAITLTLIGNELTRRGAPYVLGLDPEPTADPAGPGQNEVVPGLFYRRPRLHTLIIKDRAGGYVDSMQLLLPNDGPIARVEFPAYPWITTDFKFVFKEGMLTSYKADVPSQALAVASAPARVLKAIIAIPTELVQLKIDLSKKDNEVTTAQKAYIDSQIALIEAQMKLLAAEDAKTANDEARAQKKNGQ